MEEKVKAYILCTKTFREIEEISKNSKEYSEFLYRKEIDRKDLSEEQRKIQMRNHWATRVCDNFRLWNANFEDLIKKKIMSEVISGCKENIAQKVFNDILDTEIRFICKVYNVNGSTKISIIDEVGEEKNGTYDYSTDLNELEDIINKTKLNVSFRDDGEEVYVEEMYVEIYTGAYNNFSENIKKSINKHIKRDLTYCLKNGKLIIPDEYISKGEKGIEEWRNIKSSKNKSNSIENKLIKETVRAKKQYAYDSVCRAMDKLVSANDSYDWTIPRLMIDGKYNKQRTQKLASKILDTKDKQKLIEMSEQEIIDKVKEYWKQKLMNAYNEVDKLEI